MERLGIETLNKVLEVMRIVEKCCGGFNDSLEIAKYEFLKKLKGYMELEGQGRLLKLPCAVGDMVWDNDFGKPCGYTVTGFSIGKIDDDEENDIDGLKMYYQNWNGSIRCSCAVSEIGKTVFLTREEAEVALKEICRTAE